jgi:prolyl 4-hydroxylase
MNVLPWSRVLNEIIYGELTVTPHTRSNTQPFAFFSTDGEKILDEVDFGENSLPLLMQHGMVLLFQGGNWIWPGVHIGFKRQVNVVSGYLSPHTDQASSLLEIETISMKPLVLSVKNFISEKECDHIQNIAEPDMEYSSVSLMDKDKGRPASDFRTSQSAFLVAQDEIMHALEDRTASLTRIPKNHQEYTQVLRYGYSEKYSAHLDWFDPELYQQDPQTQSLIDYGKRNRLATVFWYLSNVEKGGHTVFPRFNGAPQPYDFDDCTKGLKVKPEKGKVIIFYSMLPNGQGDPLSLHGACPVEKGIKWAANKWIWNAKMTFLE